MSSSPGHPGEYEVVVLAGRPSVWTTRLRSAAHGGRIRLAHLRRWLRTPQGRRAVVGGARGVAVAAALLTGWVLVRHWAASARGALATIAAVYRTAAGALGAGVEGVRFVLSLRWLARLLRWSSTRSVPGAHRHCPDCHARIRSDAHVCYRCGCRDLAASAQRRHGGGRLLWQIVALRLYRRCPDCRRFVHADARICRACGYRLGR